MADGNALANLYPQPVQSPLASPGAVFDLVNRANALQEFQAKQAVGTAYQRALQSDGSVDQNALAAGLKDPSATLAVPWAIGTALDQRNKAISNARAEFELGAGQNAYVANRIAALANKPGLSSDDVSSAILDLARGTNVPTTVLNGWRQAVPQDPGQLKGYLTNLATSIGGAGTSFDRTDIVGPNGERISIPKGAANYGGALTTGNPLGAEQSAQVMQGDLARAGAYPSDIFPLEQALQKVQALGPGGTGPGSAGRQQIESFVQSLSPSVAKWIGIDPEKVKNYDEFVKYSNQGVSQRANGMGAHTNEQFGTVLSGSPGAHISDLANTDVLKAAIGIRRMEQAQTLDAQKAGGPNYTTAKGSWAASQDPRAYIIDKLSPEQLANLQKSLKGPERDKFNRSLQSAIQYGLIAPPGK